MTVPLVSVIIPARNAAQTLGDTLSSLKAQTFGEWEALVIDDKSVDATSALAKAAAADDGRIRVLSGLGQGAGAARNVGLGAARGRWVHFLDADDWITPRFYEDLLDLAARSGADAAYCAYRRVYPDGARGPAVWRPDLAKDPAKVMARQCSAAIHAVLCDRKRLLALGGFDETLRTCEDWDLWRRLAASGARFAGTPDAMALYRTTPASLSRDALVMAEDARVVLARGLSDEPADLALYGAYFAVWSAAMSIGSGRSGFEVLGHLALSDVKDNVPETAACIVDGLLVGALAVPERLPALWLAHADAVEGLLARLERASSRPGLARRLRYCAEQSMITNAPAVETITLRLSAAAPVDIADLRDLTFPEGVDRATINVFARGHWVLRFELPVFARTLSAGEIADRIAVLAPRRLLAATAALWARPRLYRTLARTLRAPLNRFLVAAGRGLRPPRLKRALTSALHEALVAALAPRDPSPAAPSAPINSAAVRSAAPTAHPGQDTGRLDYWEQVFATEDPWNYGSPYERLKYERTLSLLPEGRIERALELACAEGMFTAQLAPRVRQLTAVDISRTAVDRAAARCAGLENIAFSQLDALADDLPKDLDLIVASEFLYYFQHRAEIRDLADKLAAALRPGGRLLHAHAFVLADDPASTGFDWDHEFGGRTISETFAATPGLALERSIVTDLYRIDLFKRLDDDQAPPTPDVRLMDLVNGLEPEVEACVVWGGSEVRSADALREETTFHVPVLMYHRVSNDGAPDLSRYRVAPEAFDAQMTLLRHKGYYALPSDKLAWYHERRLPLPGRPVIITFDDGTVDFAEHAWPILRRRGLTAEVFVVTDKVGGEADWDTEYGDPALLMPWPEIERLAAEGVRFGSHLATHAAADGLGSVALLDEARRSREALESHLERPVRAIAAPFGIIDDRAARIFERAGYDLGFSTREGLAHAWEDRFALSRIEVRGDMSLEAFERSLASPSRKSKAAA